MEINHFIDHTLLKPNCKLEEIKTLCAEVQQYGFASACVPPYFVREAMRQLKFTSAKVATVIGFPMGYATTPVKEEEIKRAIADGADELDVVVNVCAVKSKDWSYVQNDIDRMTRIANLHDKIIKVILETTLLTSEEIEALCKICNTCEVDFVKTSTGFNGAGANIETLTLLKRYIAPNVQIKASGGIRTYAAARALVEAGAHRLGCSASVAIVNDIQVE